MQLTEIKPGMKLCVRHNKHDYEPVIAIEPEPYRTGAGRRAPGYVVRPLGRSKSTQYVVAPAKLRTWEQYEAHKVRVQDQREHGMELRAAVKALKPALRGMDIGLSVTGVDQPVLTVHAQGNAADVVLQLIRRAWGKGEADGCAG